MGASREFTSESSLTDWLPRITWTASKCRQVSPTFPEFTVQQGVLQGGQLRGGFCSHLIQVFSIHGFNWAFLYLCFSISSMRSWTNPVVHMLHLYIGAQGSFGDLEKQIRAIRSVIFSSLYLTHLKEKKLKGQKLYWCCLRALSKSVWPHAFGQNIVAAEVFGEWELSPQAIQEAGRRNRKEQRTRNCLRLVPSFPVTYFLQLAPTS